MNAELALQNPWWLDKAKIEEDRHIFLLDIAILAH
jgi:hypothetical protein